MTQTARLTVLALTALLVGMPAGAWEAPASAFIADLPELRADPDRPGASIWIAPDFRREEYGKVLLVPLTLYISPNSPEQGLDADVIKGLADQFRETLTHELEPDIPVVSRPGPGVLLVRGAISNIHLVKKSRGLLSYTPIGLVVRSAQSDASKLSIKQAVIEVELLDAQTGRRLAVLIDRKPGQEDGKPMTWKEVGETLQFYAARFKQRLTAGRGG